MSDLYQNSFRGYLIDHHSPSPPTVHFSALDIGEYARFFEEAEISNLMLYTKDHWGYSYYDTKIGTRHPALKLDFVGEIARILKEKKIEFNAYYCLEYDTLAPTLHPEWSIRDKDGNPVTLKGRMAKWGMPCYQTGYRDYVLGQLEEVVEKYRPDSLFLDIFGKSLCYCDACKEKFYQEYGYPLPEAESGSVLETGSFDFGEKGRDVAEFLENCAAQMLQDISARTKAILPDLKITINFAALYPKRIRDMLDYQFTEPWAGNWLSAAYSRDTARGQYPQLGPGDVSAVYNYRPDAVYQLAAHQIAAQGCRVFLYSGSQHVDGSLEHTEARKVGAAYREIEKFEQYLTNRRVIADVAIVQSDASSRAGSGNAVVGNAIGRCKKSDLHRQAVLGAMQFCDRSKYSWCVVPEQELTGEGAKAYRCIILAGVFHVGDTLAQILRDFVQSGGVLIADGKSGLLGQDGKRQPDFTLADLYGCKYQSELKEFDSAQWGGYLSLAQGPLRRHLPQTLPPLGPTQLGVKAQSAQVLGTLMRPCVRLTDTTWVNWWCPPPESQDSGLPMILQNDFGRGKSLYFAFDFFSETEMNLWPDLFRGALDFLVKNPSLRLETDIPQTVGFTAYRRENQILVHSLSHLAEHMNGDCPPVPGGVLHLGESLGTLTWARLVYPQCQELEISQGKICLPHLTMHQIVVIDCEK